MRRRATDQQPLTDGELDARVIRLGNSIYTASSVIEDAEHQGFIIGNGHHIRQEAAQLVQRLMLSRWHDKEQAGRIAKKRGMEL